MTVVAPCVRCEHGADVHRIDDYDATSPRDPIDPATPFRCVVDGCDCPDYVDEPLRKKTGKES